MWLDHLTVDLGSASPAHVKLYGCICIWPTKQVINIVGWKLALNKRVICRIGMLAVNGCINNLINVLYIYTPLTFPTVTNLSSDHFVLVGMYFFVHCCI